jgi:hypothetical protein
VQRQPVAFRGRQLAPLRQGQVAERHPDAWLLVAPARRVHFAPETVSRLNGSDRLDADPRARHA